MAPCILAEDVLDDVCGGNPFNNRPLAEDRIRSRKRLPVLDLEETETESDGGTFNELDLFTVAVGPELTLLPLRVNGGPTFPSSKSEELGGRNGIHFT